MIRWNDEVERRAAHKRRVLRHLETAATAQGFGDDKPRPRTDYHRAYRQEFQLTAYEHRVLAAIRREPMQVVLRKGAPEFRVRGRPIRRDVAERLIKYGYIIPDDPGLLPDVWAQSYKLP